MYVYLIYQFAQQKVEKALEKITDSKNKLAYEKGKLQVWDLSSNFYLIFNIVIVEWIKYADFKKLSVVQSLCSLGSSLTSCLHYQPSDSCS